MSKIINCTASCSYYHQCKDIADQGGYRFWYCLLKCLYSDRRPKQLVRELITEARIFIPEYRIMWRGGVCICDAPYGDYVWHFAVRMKQEQLWNHYEFRQGYEYGLNDTTPDRGHNPYQEPARNGSWDCGYILGLHHRDIAKGKRK